MTSILLMALLIYAVVSITFGIEEAIRFWKEADNDFHQLALWRKTTTFLLIVALVAMIWPLAGIKKSYGESS